MKVHTLSVAFVAALSVTASGQQSGQTKPDFSGTWVIDMDKSSIPKQPKGDSFNARHTANIIHWRSSLIVGRSGDAQHLEVEYLIEGPAERQRHSRNRVRRLEGDGFVEHVYRSRWDGAKIVTEITRPGPGGTIVSTETRYMEGDQMVVTEMGPGDRRTISYWTKRAEIDYWKNR